MQSRKYLLLFSLIPHVLFSLSALSVQPVSEPLAKRMKADDAANPAHASMELQNVPVEVLQDRLFPFLSVLNDEEVKRVEALLESNARNPENSAKVSEAKPAIHSALKIKANSKAVLAFVNSTNKNLRDSLRDEKDKAIILIQISQFILRALTSFVTSEPPIRGTSSEPPIHPSEAVAELKRTVNKFRTDKRRFCLNKGESQLLFSALTPLKRLDSVSRRELMRALLLLRTDSSALEVFAENVIRDGVFDRRGIDFVNVNFTMLCVLRWIPQNFKQATKMLSIIFNPEVLEAAPYFGRQECFDALKITVFAIKGMLLQINFANITPTSENQKDEKAFIRMLVKNVVRNPRDYLDLVRGFIKQRPKSIRTELIQIVNHIDTSESSDHDDEDEPIEERHISSALQILADTWEPSDDDEKMMQAARSAYARFTRIDESDESNESSYEIRMKARTLYARVSKGENLCPTEEFLQNLINYAKAHYADEDETDGERAIHELFDLHIHGCKLPQEALDAALLLSARNHELGLAAISLLSVLSPDHPTIVASLQRFMKPKDDIDSSDILNIIPSRFNRDDILKALLHSRAWDPEKIVDWVRNNYFRFPGKLPEDLQVRLIVWWSQVKNAIGIGSILKWVDPTSIAVQQQMVFPLSIYLTHEADETLKDIVTFFQPLENIRSAELKQFLKKLYEASDDKGTVNDEVLVALKRLADLPLSGRKRSQSI